MKRFFSVVAEKTAEAVGSPWAFTLSLLVVIGWALTGPLFEYSDTWQLVINTTTTVVTFLVVFLIQNAQNRDAKAVHLKLDELLRGLKGPRTSMVDLESLTDEELDKLQQEFRRLREGLAGGASEKEAQREIRATDKTLAEAEDTIEETQGRIENARERKAS